MNSFETKLELGLSERENLLQAGNQSAIRLFNGFLEGYPFLVVELYAQTVVLFDYRKSLNQSDDIINKTVSVIQKKYPWIHCGIHKKRVSQNIEERKGFFLWGDHPDKKIIENGIFHAIDLRLNQDSSFYIDTRKLRDWIIKELPGKTLLNTFAYTGSLGTVAAVSGAKKVVQLDRSEKFLNIGKQSLLLNHVNSNVCEFLVGDFWKKSSYYRKINQLFDCVILDPPFLAKGSKGNIDIVHEFPNLIKKIQPLVADGGSLILVNNALQVSGPRMQKIIQSLESPYLHFEEIIDVPEDLIGCGHKVCPGILKKYEPFNYSTKIVRLSVKRKDSFPVDNF